jgi:hypothetical protein
MVNIVDNSTPAVGVGGSITFSGMALRAGYANHWQHAWGGIKGYKENNSSDSYGGTLLFYTSSGGSAWGEVLKLDSVKNATFAGNIYAGGSQVGTRIDGNQIGMYGTGSDFYVQNYSASNGNTVIGKSGAGTLKVQNDLSCAGDITWSGGGSANANTAYGWGNRRYSGTASINSSGFTTVATVDGSYLGSTIRMTVTGTANNTVICEIIDIVVNHYQDINIQSQSSSYTQITVKIQSDNNDNFAIQLKTNSAIACTVYMEIFALNSESVSFTSTNPYSGIALTHICRLGGFSASSGGGETHNFWSNGVALAKLENPTFSGDVSTGNGGIAWRTYTGTTNSVPGAKLVATLGTTLMATSCGMTFRIASNNSNPHSYGGGNASSVVGDDDIWCSLHNDGNCYIYIGSGYYSQPYKVCIFFTDV